jgi:hypothetical protein
MEACPHAPNGAWTIENPASGLAASDSRPSSSMYANPFPSRSASIKTEKSCPGSPGGTPPAKKSCHELTRKSSGCQGGGSVSCNRMKSREPIRSTPMLIGSDAPSRVDREPSGRLEHFVAVTSLGTPGIELSGSASGWLAVAASTEGCRCRSESRWVGRSWSGRSSATPRTACRSRRCELDPWPYRATSR